VLSTGTIDPGNFPLRVSFPSDMKTPFAVLLALVLIVLPQLSAAAGPALVTAPGGLAVTGDEVNADVAQRVPADARAQILSTPGDVAQLAVNIAMRRVLAAEAEKAQFDKDPQVALQLRLARERVLAEARLAQIDGERPERAALEKAALAEYRAEPDKYAMPEEVRVRHILIDSRSCEPEKRIAELLQQARAPGADFVALARANSQDQGSAARGGDVGFFAAGRMAPEFEKAAFALKNPGDISDVVKTKSGLHIIRLEERKPAGQQPFEKVRDAIVQDLSAREVRRRRAEATDATTKSLQVNREAVEAFAKQAR
jgi:peptidyl-prolyl cis-trans isomerase C